MNITFFSTPKAFVDIYDVIQTNAITSWAKHPGSHVVLVGNDTGVADIANRLTLTHIPSIQTNDLGTPLVSDMVKRSSEVATTPWMAFVNSDIIVPPNLGLVIAQLVTAFHGPVVFACRRWNIDVDTHIDFSDPSWFEQLDQSTQTRRQLYAVYGMDLFVFPKGFYDCMPPFSIGWPGAKYDNWFVWYARHKGVPVVDITDAVTLFHQNHPPGGGAVHPAKMREHRDSLKLLGGYGNCFDIRDASHRVDADGTLRVVRPDLAHLALGFKRMIQRGRDYFLLK